MVEIAMGQAAKLMGMTTRAARRALLREGHPMRELTVNAFVVEESEVEKYVAAHGVSKGRGRRLGDKNKPKE